MIISSGWSLVYKGIVGQCLVKVSTLTRHCPRVGIELCVYTGRVSWIWGSVHYDCFIRGVLILQRKFWTM